MAETTTHSSHRRRGLLIALVGTTAWATTGVIISYLLAHYPIQPLTLAFWREVLMSTTLVAILAVTRRPALAITRRDLPFLAAYGLGLGVFSALWTFSVKYNGAAVATVLVYSSPAFTVLLARPLLKEPITPRKLVAVLLSLSGSVLVARAYSAEAWVLNPLGILLGVATGVCFAGYSLAGRWSARHFTSSWTITAYGFVFAALALLVTQTPTAAFSLGDAWDGWAILAALAIGPSLIGFGLYNLSLRTLEASTAGLVASLEPALTAAMAMVALGERLAPEQLLGGGMILAAVVIVQTKG